MDEVNCQTAMSPQKENVDTGQNINALNKVEDEIETLDRIPKKSVPNVNIPEKVIFCIDVCNNQFHIPAESPLEFVRSALKFFVDTKKTLNPHTKFAGIALTIEGPIWLDLNEGSPDLLLYDEYTVFDESTPIDLDPIFKMISEKIILPDEDSDIKIGLPDNSYRLILIYKRSCLPSLSSESTYFNSLKDHSHFTIDIIYLHDEKWQNNKCKEIYEALQYMDNGYSYIYEVENDENKLFQCMAKLLAHPFQRPSQKNSCYTLLNKNLNCM